MRETKRVATQNIEFEDWVKSVCKSVFGTLVQPGFRCNKKIDYFSIDWFATTPKKSIETLMQQIEPENIPRKLS